MTEAVLTERETPLAVGDIAPDFTLPDQDKNDVTLSELLKKGEVVLCFFPLAFSPICSTEMTCITEDLDKYAGNGATVLGISADSFFTLKAWAEQLGLKQTLLADMHRKVAKAYGMYFEPLNISGRGTFVIGTDGKVKWAQVRELGDGMDREEVLAAVAG